MLLYNIHDNRFLNLSLDTFERSKISFIFQNVIREINNTHRLHDTKSRNYIRFQRFSQNHILKDKLQLQLYIYSAHFPHRVITSHMNPYKYQKQYIMGCYVKRYNNFIIYKYMMLPLGKIRIEKFKANISADYIL